ncbi:hypothetical protein DSLASN_32590 [Desulfoluna limicola]|uniref:CheW-like domain-containing protein n=1 Tax=Desulfoluna limicola TaxID=2810562 RepID=A0ABN6F864_9BACT|nr:chemotaxis protein CheW [Desulfoluna limicola]BCS97627.1 hypothetical protein DSLASN_32590 [Desulfoluna limicola]
MQKYLSFSVGGLNLGVDMTSVIAIEQGGALAGEKPSELKPGTVSFAGQALPLYNVSGLLGRRGSDPARGFESKVLIVRTAGGTTALWVDRVGSVMEAIDNNVSELPPVFSGMAGVFFSRVLLGADGLILLLNPDAVAPVALSVQMARAEAEACESVGGAFEGSALCSAPDFECQGTVGPVDMAAPWAQEEAVSDFVFDVVADLAAEPEACDVPGGDAAELPEGTSPEDMAPLDMALPDALEEAVPELGFDAVADLAAAPEACDETAMDAAELPEGLGPEAVAPLDMALPDALEEAVPELGFDAVADLAAAPEACDETAMDAAELPEGLGPEAVAPLDMALLDALEEAVPELGFDAVADLAAAPEACDETAMDAAELSEALGAEAVAPLDMALPDALEEAVPELGFDAVADLAAAPEACDETAMVAAELSEALGAEAVALLDMALPDALEEAIPDLGFDAVADLADKADGCEDDEVTTGQGWFVYVETPEELPADEQKAPLDLVAPDEAAECVGETCQCEAGGSGVESPEADAGVTVGAEAAETPCPDAGPVADDEPVIDLVEPFPEDLVQAVEAEASARLQENDTLSSLMEKAITPDLLERVVDRVVTSMITELVSGLTSDVADSQKDQETSPLY